MKVKLIAVIGGGISVLLATYFNYHLWRGLYYILRWLDECVNVL